MLRNRPATAFSHCSALRWPTRTIRSALYAALRMQEDVKRHAQKLRAEKGVNLQVRIGVNTGEVVVRSIETDDAHTEYTPIGHSTSLASRLADTGEPGVDS